MDGWRYKERPEEEQMMIKIFSTKEVVQLFDCVSCSTSAAVVSPPRSGVLLILDRIAGS